ncbi:unnamed protein product [Nippostrongylus brasiliensis]|uniref:Uncharacterized protein n=1 Tax=Nippostrongylus brasiliensis TaxID=27835 RepID=A0A0N4XUP4_NIPBR|nr:unnamed protein product [Nippostrongylus brasiliensis]
MESCRNISIHANSAHPVATKRDDIRNMFRIVATECFNSVAAAASRAKDLDVRQKLRGENQSAHTSRRKKPTVAPHAAAVVVDLSQLLFAADSPA